MYNNLESETLILKRLESALANEDNDLLKIAAYKLHEKFHSGYRFEYIKQLKSVYDYVYDNPVFDEQIALLLTSTIEDIINKKDEPKKEEVTSVIDEIFPSSNTFTAYATEYKQEEKTEIQKDLFSSFIQGNQTKIEETATIQEEPIQYTEEITTKPTIQELNQIEEVEEIENIEETKEEEQIIEQTQNVVFETIKEPIEETISEAITPTNDEAPQVIQYNAQSENKNICIFLGEKNSDIDEKFIKDFIKTLNKDESLSKELNELQTFINIVEQDLGPIEKIINPIKDKAQNLTIIKNSINGKIVDILNTCNIFENFYALSGLTRELECRECGEKFINYSSTQILSCVCNKCGNYMLPSIKEPKNSRILDINNAIYELANSAIWVLINPPKENEMDFVNILKTTAEIKNPEKIYILTQDENKNSFYKKLFENTKSEIRADFSNTENFLTDFEGAQHCNTQQMQLI